MRGLPSPRTVPRRLAWLTALLPFALGLYSLGVQGSSVRAAQRPGLGLPSSGPIISPPSSPGTTPAPTSDRSIIFNDQSPTPSGHDLSASHYVGYMVCAGCHGRLTSTRRDHTIIQEWDQPT